MRRAATVRWAWAILLSLGTWCAATVMADDHFVPAGAGGYVTAMPPGVKGPQAEIYRTAHVPGPMPTNDWWSSLAWRPFSERQYPHPLAVQAQAQGLRVYVPGQITANKDAVFGFMPEQPRGDGQIGDDLVLGHSAVDKFDDARVDGFSDWFVTARFGGADRGMSVSYGHGSPYVFATFDGGDARVSFAKPPTIWAGSEKTATIGLSIGNKHYALFAPAGSTWDGVGTKVLTAHANGKRYFSLAALPDADERTLKLFQQYAHAHVTGTKVEWAYDAKSAAVATTYTFETKAYEGTQAGTLFALYPHQWRYTKSPLTDLSYNTVRGRMKLAQGTSFATSMTFHGVLPALPDAGGADRAKLAEMVQADGNAPAPKAVKDTYWEGKELGKLASLAPLAEQVGDAATAAAIHESLKSRLETWLNPRDAGGGIRKSGVFYYDKNWGTLIGYPASYGSDVELNDHHFHYGYFFKGAAEVARVEPAWAADARWGAMLKLLVRDVASTDRGDPLFPFLRNFDPYAGHSWASGHAIFGDGNNNESSSEAMNAWTGLILLGEAIGDRSMRDLGIYLYTTELAGIQEYWFDVHGDNRPASYTPSVVTMVWGGKGANGTWFTNKPGAVHGINFLPMHGGSLYLGLFPEYAEKNYKALVAENKGDDFKDWPDISWMFRALTDAGDAMRLYEAAGAKYPGEGGNTRANTYDWIAQLGVLGRVDPTVSADHPLYAVFKKGDVRSYAAYNMTDRPLSVTFSDGFVLKVEKKGFGLARK